MSVIGKAVRVLTTATELVPQYITFKSPTASFTLTPGDGTVAGKDGILEYSTDAETWIEWDELTALSSGVQNGSNVLYIRGTGNTTITGTSGSVGTKGWHITGSNVSVIGNIAALLDWRTVAKGRLPEISSGAFSYLFGHGANQSSWGQAIKYAHQLVIPYEELPGYAFCYMFRNQKALLTPPSLPAMTVGQFAYQSMFDGAAALTIPPALQATSIRRGSYKWMFNACTGLKTPVSLSVVELPQEVYYGMYNGCSSLKVSSSSDSSTYISNFRVPSTGTGTIGTDSLTDMLVSTGGSVTGTPSINTYYYTENYMVDSTYYTGSTLSLYENGTFSKFLGDINSPFFALKGTVNANTDEIIVNNNAFQYWERDNDYGGIVSKSPISCAGYGNLRIIFDRVVSWQDSNFKAAVYLLSSKPSSVGSTGFASYAYRKQFCPIGTTSAGHIWYGQYEVIIPLSSMQGGMYYIAATCASASSLSITGALILKKIVLEQEGSLPSLPRYIWDGYDRDAYGSRPWEGGEAGGFITIQGTSSSQNDGVSYNTATGSNPYDLKYTEMNNDYGGIRTTQKISFNGYTKLHIEMNELTSWQASSSYYASVFLSTTAYTKTASNGYLSSYQLQHVIDDRSSDNTASVIKNLEKQYNGSFLLESLPN